MKSRNVETLLLTPLLTYLHFFVVTVWLPRENA